MTSAKSKHTNDAQIPDAELEAIADEAGEQDALEALASDEGAEVVADPDPQTLIPTAEKSESTTAETNVEGDVEVTVVPFEEADAVSTTPVVPIEPVDTLDDATVVPATETTLDSKGASYEDDRLGASPFASDAASSELDQLEQAAIAQAGANPAETAPFTPIDLAEARAAFKVNERISGSAKGTGTLSWGSRTDVGCVRDHNEDSFLIQFPLFAVADGMGGHAAGEIASTVAVSALSSSAPLTPDQEALADSIEQANLAVIQAAANGLGRPGMGTTTTAVVIDGGVMAVGHVGDSRCYLVHKGQLVRVTHDHSYVEELVAAGQITAEEARVHPNRSVITRALGSDPDMTADSFLIDVERGDRVLLCSDGLNSMIDDAQIEEAMVSSPSPQACADALVELALKAGGYDNVTCVVIDVKDDGTASHAIRTRLRNIVVALLSAVAVILAVALAMFGMSQHRWYLSDVNGYVALYQGIPGDWGPLPFNSLSEVTDIQTAQLSDAVSSRLSTGIVFGDETDARSTIEGYRAQLASEEASRAQESEKISTSRESAGGSNTSAETGEDSATSSVAGTATRVSSGSVAIGPAPTQAPATTASSSSTTTSSTSSSSRSSATSSAASNTADEDATDEEANN